MKDQWLANRLELVVNALDCHRTVLLVADSGHGKDRIVRHVLDTFGRQGSFVSLLDVRTKKLDNIEESLTCFCGETKGSKSNVQNTSESGVVGIIGLSTAHVRDDGVCAAHFRHLLRHGYRLLISTYPEGAVLFADALDCKSFDAQDLAYSEQEILCEVDGNHEHAHQLYAVTRGMPFLVEQAMTQKTNNFDKQQCVALCAVRRGLMEEEFALRLGMLALGEGTFDDLSRIGLRVSCDLLTSIMQASTLFGISIAERTFSCGLLSDMQCSAIAQDASGHHSHLTAKIVEHLIDSDKSQRAALFIQACKRSLDLQNAVRKNPLFFFERGITNPVKQLCTSEEELPLMSRSRGAIIAGAICSARDLSADDWTPYIRLLVQMAGSHPSKQQLDALLLVLSFLLNKSRAESARYLALIDRAIQIAAASSSSLTRRLMVHLQCRRMLALGNIDGAYKVLGYLCPDDLEHQTLSSKLIQQDFLVVGALLGKKCLYNHTVVGIDNKDFFQDTMLEHVVVCEQLLSTLVFDEQFSEEHLDTLRSHFERAHMVGYMMLVDVMQALYAGIHADHETYLDRLTAITNYATADDFGMLRPIVDEMKVPLMDGQVGSNLCSIPYGIFRLVVVAKERMRHAMHGSFFISQGKHSNECDGASSCLSSMHAMNCLHYATEDAISNPVDQHFISSSSDVCVDVRDDNKGLATVKSQGKDQRLAIKTQGKDQRLAIKTQGKDQRLAIKLLGGFKVIQGERSVPLSGWKRSAAITLMVVLGMLREHRITRVKAVNLLWPDLDFLRGRQNLYSAVSALRHALRSINDAFDADKYVLSVAGNLVLNENLVQVDVDAYERAAIQLRACRGSDESLIQDAHAVLDLYTGPLFIPSGDTTGCFKKRQSELMNLFCDCMVVGSEASLRFGRDREALCFASAAYRTDNEREDIIECYTRSLVKIGRINEAQKAYENYESYCIHERDKRPSARLCNRMALLFGPENRT